jgi:hypothetical protein
MEKPRPRSTGLLRFQGWEPVTAGGHRHRKCNQSQDGTFLGVGFGRRPFCCNLTPMARGDLHVEVKGGEIIVTLPFSRYGVTYYKPAKSPQLLARRISDQDDPNVSLTLSEFLGQAWRAANHKARELGWIV